MGRRPQWTAVDSGDAERSELVKTLDKHRGFLRHTLRDLTDEQARLRTTVSELCLGGIVKHVTRMEERWIAFIEQGPSVIGGMDERSMKEHAGSFTMLPGDTVDDLLSRYKQVADRTDALIRGLPSLNDSQPLPEAPWFEKTRWSARRVILHILAETAQHAGHADIIREVIDGAKTMG
ncbi:MAG: DinB family protein [Acidimicrobiales bacterium]